MAITVSTAVLLAVFSSMVKVWSPTTGASFTLVRLTVMVPVPVKVPVPSSWAWTVTLKEVVVS